nr:sodium:solute symporter family protein [Kroppenstedtia pulmonis]
MEVKPNPSDKETKFWTSPVTVGMLGITAVFSLIYLYSIFTDRNIYWGGLSFMVIAYALVYYIGAVTAKNKSDSLNDMMLGGRQIPLWISMFTMASTWVGGGYINGTAEAAYASGLVWAQAPWAYAVSLIIGGIFYARIMRRYEFTTMLDPLESRFGSRITGLLFLAPLTGEIFWSGAILTALGTTFGTILGLDFTTSILLSAAIAIAYTVAGGLWSVVYTDVVQFGMILVGLFLVVPFAIGHTGGFAENWNHYTVGMEKMGANFSSLFPPLDGWKNPDWGAHYWSWWDSALMLIFGAIPWQVYFQRVLSARSENAAMWLSILAGIWAIIAAVPAVLIGTIGFNTDWSAIGIQEPENSAMILPYVLRYLTPEVVGWLGLGALAAAVMSSVDSSILSASSMAAWNVYRPLIKPRASEKQIKKVIKRSIIIMGVAATLIAINVKSVYELWYLCSDFVYCILFPQLTMALFFKGANKYGSATGLVVAFVLRFGGGEPVLGIPQIIPYPLVEDGEILFPFRTLAMVSSLIAIYVVSKLTAKICPPQPLRNLRKI